MSIELKPRPRLRDAIKPRRRPADREKSTWRERAREALKIEIETKAAPLVDDRREQMWDVREEPRAVSWTPRWHETTIEPARRPVAKSTWAWWEIWAPVAIAACVIAQLIGALVK